MYDEQGNTLKEVIIKSTYIGMPKNVVKQRLISYVKYNNSDTISLSMIFAKVICAKRNWQLDKAVH